MLCQKNQKLTTKGSPERSRGTKICPKKSTSVPSDARWAPKRRTMEKIADALMKI
jgi:hypothetical protein